MNADHPEAQQAQEQGSQKPPQADQSKWNVFEDHFQQYQ